MIIVLSAIRQGKLGTFQAHNVIKFLLTPDNIQQKFDQSMTAAMTRQTLLQQYKMLGGGFFARCSISCKFNREDVYTELQSRARIDEDGASARTLKHFSLG